MALPPAAPRVPVQGAPPPLYSEQEACPTSPHPKRSKTGKMTSLVGAFSRIALGSSVSARRGQALTGAGWVWLLGGRPMRRPSSLRHWPRTPVTQPTLTQQWVMSPAHVIHWNSLAVMS